MKRKYFMSSLQTSSCLLCLLSGGTALKFCARVGGCSVNEEKALNQKVFLGHKGQPHRGILSLTTFFSLLLSVSLPHETVKTSLTLLLPGTQSCYSFSTPDVQGPPRQLKRAKKGDTTYDLNLTGHPCSHKQELDLEKQ